jgi:hypothetical protein
MTAPRSDSQPNTETFESKLRRAQTRDPLDTVEQNRLAGHPDRRPDARVTDQSN